MSPVKQEPPGVIKQTFVNNNKTLMVGAAMQPYLVLHQYYKKANNSSVRYQAIVLYK